MTVALLKPNNSSIQCSTRDSPPYRYMIPQYTDIERFFSINSEDGLITTTKPLDRETQAWHNISVSATEIGTHKLSRREAKTCVKLFQDLRGIGTGSDARGPSKHQNNICDSLWSRFHAQTYYVK